MENNYRDMMNEVRAPESLRGSVMNMTEREQTKKTRPTSMRVLMAAACICALLVVGAVAAEVAGVDVEGSMKAVLGIRVSEVRTIEDEEHGEMTGWYIRGSVKPEHLSEAFWADVQSVPLEEKGYGTLDKDFNSREEIENYLGLALTDNPMLEGNGRHWHVMASITEGEAEREVSYINIFATFWIELSESGEQQSVSVFLDVWTSTLGENASIGTWYVNVAESTRENYVTPNGLEAAISTLYLEPVTNEDGTEDHIIRCIANFHLNGLNYELGIYESSERKELADKVMKQVLDAYQ